MTVLLHLLWLILLVVGSCLWAAFTTTGDTHSDGDDTPNKTDTH